MIETLKNVTWLAWLTPVILLWGQVRDFAVRLTRLLIRTDQFDRHICYAIEGWLRSRGGLAPGVRHWGMAWIPLRQGSDSSGPVVIDAGDSVQTWFAGKWRIPVRWNMPAGTLTYLWGSVDVDTILEFVRGNELKGEESNAALARRRIWRDADFGAGFAVERWPDRSMLADARGSFGGGGRQMKSSGALDESSPAAPPSGGRVGDNQGAVAMMSNRYSGSIRPWYECVPLYLDLRPEIESIRATTTAGCESVIRFPLWGPMLAFQADFRLWASSGSWFHSKDIRWRRGALLYGPPGSGKTEIALRTARDFNCRLISLDLSSMDNNMLAQVAGRMRDYGRVILLIEDIDAVFNGRKNVSDPGAMECKLTFDALINFIGGVHGMDGVYVVVTTNRREVLDDALVRDGRLDLKLEVPLMGRDAARLVAEFIMEGIECDIDGLLDTMELPLAAGSVAEKFKREAMKAKGFERESPQ